MLAKKESCHVSYMYEENDIFFQLGYQIINKQKTESTIKCLKVLYNNKIKVMYSIENLVSIDDILNSMSVSEVLMVIKEIYRIIDSNIKDGFFKKEAFEVSYEKIFFDKAKGKTMLIVLPVNDECDMHDDIRWNKRLNNTILKILNYIQKDSENLFIGMCDFFVNEKPTFEKAKDILLGGNARVNTSANISKTSDLRKNTESFENRTLYLEYKDGKKIKIYKDDMIFGSSERMSDVVIDGSKAISRMHFRIIKKAGRYILTDLDSTNHTYRNGHMIKDGEEAVINSGDIIKAANIELIVRCV